MKSLSYRPARSVRSAARRAAACLVEAIENRVLLSAADLDPTFGNGGYLNDADAGGAAYVQGNDKLVLAGAAGDTVTLSRYNADGSPDASFGPAGNGRATFTVPLAGREPTSVSLHAVTEQPDGKILIAGTAPQLKSEPDQAQFGATDFLVARFNPNGSIDTTFGGGDGVEFTSFGGDGAFDVARSVAVAPDGQIVLAGSSLHAFTPGRSGVALAWYAPDGTPLHSNTYFIGDGNSRGYDMVVQPDDKVLVAVGATRGGRYLDFFLDRFNADGTLDRESGPVFFNPAAPGSSPDATSYALDLLSDGDVVVVGGLARSDFLAARYNGSDLSLDRGFGGAGTGTVAVDFGGKTDDAYDVKVMAGDKILIAGLSYHFDYETVGSTRQDPQLSLARLNPDGTLDTTFDAGDAAPDGRRAYTSPLPSSEHPLALTPDGKFVVAGDGIVARFQGDAPAQPPTGGFSQTYQAEDARVANGASPTRTTTGGSTGTGYVDYGDRAGEYVEFTVNVPEAGSYYLDFRYANGSSAARGLALAVNGASVANLPFPPTGNWSTWKVGAASAPLKAGTNTIRLTTTGQSGPNLDALTVRSTTVTPPPPTDGATTYEAEQAALSGAVVAKEKPGYTGTGYADYYNLSNDYAEFTVNAASAGTYTLTFRYANGGAAARALGLQVNGVTRGSVSFDPTGSWTNWKTVAATAYLTAGANKVRLTATGQSGPNLDSLTVASTNEQPPPGGLTFEAEDANLSGPAKANNVPGYSGTGFADYLNPSGDYVTFSAIVGSEGDYFLDFRYANGSGATRHMDLRVGTAPGSVQPIAFPPTGSWSNWATVTVPVTLGERINAVQLIATGESGPNLDKLTVRDREVQPPPPPPAGGKTFEAEDARWSGAVVASNVAGYTGSGFVDYRNPSNDFVEFSVPVTTGGIYRLTFRYANGGAAARTLGLSVNGAPVAGGVTFAPTGSWSNWGTVSIDLPLLSDAFAAVRLTATGQSGPNLDNLLVAPVA